MFKRFCTDLIYGYPAFSNLFYQIKENYKEKTGYYKMQKIPLNKIRKYIDIKLHKRQIVTKRDASKLIKAIRDYNEIVDTL